MNFVKTTLLIYVFAMLLFSSCKTTSELPISLPNTYSSNVQSQQPKELHIEGAIQIATDIGFNTFINQILFIGVPETPLSHPLINSEERELVKNSLMYKEVMHKGLKGKFVIEREGQYYFLYNAFRLYLEDNQLIQKFGY